MIAEGKEVREFNGRKSSGTRPARRFRLHQGLERRPLGQSGLSQDGAQFQSR